MKKFIYNISVITGLLLGMSGCMNDFLDLAPQDQKTDAVFFKKASDFKEYTAGCYGQLMGWKAPYGSAYDNMDISSDLMVYSGFSSDLGHGTIRIPSSDARWDKNYEFIRTANILFEKAKDYPGASSEITPYLAEAYFFRGYAYFNLLRFFGGVPVLLKVLDTDSPELTAPRNTRYEVVNQILSDLQQAIDGLPIEQEIPSAEKGRLSKWAAMAFKARVLLYEATWRKYNQAEGEIKCETDFEGSAGPEKDQINDFLEESINLSKRVIDNGGYEIWNYNTNEKIKNQSNMYLFNLEGADSNPAGLTKESNKEFILYGVYDVVLRQGGINLNHTVSSQVKPSRKLIDMFLCIDGLPISKSTLFQGYKTVPDEYKNRDLRLVNYISGGTAPVSSPTLNSGTYSGYNCAKFVTYASRKDTEESANYPVLRLAEVYLNYAEAYYERYQKVDDSWLKGINDIRKRAGVASLTAKLITDNQLDPLTEIRRERTLELFMEGFRFDDLKRWGIAEKELNASRCGAVVGDSNYPTEYINSDGKPTSKYTQNVYPYGEEEVEIETAKWGKKKYKCVVIDGISSFHFSKKHYLFPIPQTQIDRNPNLKQNPGYN
ncbi:RagB/SusD family nutrient uptake outer membrane protein [Bacteroides congonensis]